MKEADRQWQSVEVAKDLIHAVTLDTSEPFVLFENYGDPIGRIDNLGHLKFLKQIAICTFKKDLVALGEEEMAEQIIVFQYERENNGS